MKRGRDLNAVLERIGHAETMTQEKALALDEIELKKALALDEIEQEALFGLGQSYAGLSDRALAEQMLAKNWKNLETVQRLRLMQECENRRAKADRRKPIKLLICPAEKMGKVAGQYGKIWGMEFILLNSNLLEDGKLKASNAAEALNTVLHEGRHAFQHNAVDRNDPTVSRRQKMMWACNMLEKGGWYFDGSDENGGILYYAIQEIEMDARRFARQQIKKMNEYFASQGIADPGFIKAYQLSLADEEYVMMRIRTELTLDAITEIEEALLNRMREHYPEEDLRDVRLFDFAKTVLLHPEIDNIEDMLELTDRMAEEIDRIHEDMPEKKLNRMQVDWGGINRMGNA